MNVTATIYTLRLDKEKGADGKFIDTQFRWTDPNRIVGLKKYCKNLNFNFNYLTKILFNLLNIKS